MSLWKWFSTKFHSHEWEVYQERQLRIFDPYDNKRTTASGVRYVLQCKVCGELKLKDSI